MRTARSSSPQEQAPPLWADQPNTPPPHPPRYTPEQVPPRAGTPPEQVPPESRYPPRAGTPLQQAPHSEQVPPSGQNSWHTFLKILPCP